MRQHKQFSQNAHTHTHTLTESGAMPSNCTSDFLERKTTFNHREEHRSYFSLRQLAIICVSGAMHIDSHGRGVHFTLECRKMHPEINENDVRSYCWDDWQWLISMIGSSSAAFDMRWCELLSARHASGTQLTCSSARSPEKLLDFGDFFFFPLLLFCRRI